jgi:hypothetical protein
MLEESLAQQPTLIWNSVRGVWEKPMASLLCEHWELFSEAWPTSGMMQNGQVFELQMQEHRTADTESLLQQLDNLPTPKARDSQAEGYEAGLRRATPQVGTIVKGLVDGDARVLLRSPKASEGQGGALGEAEATRRGNTVGVRDQVMDLVSSQGLKVSRAADNLLPTPNTMEHLPARTGEARNRQLYRGGSDSKRSSSGNLREDILDLMPTPKALDGVKGNLKTSEERLESGHQVDLPNVAIDLQLIGTPRATASDSSSVQVANGAPKGRIEDQVKLTNWGKFEPAIRRWEQTLGITAPSPTKPDGKENSHRLSSEFTEWMMGLEQGWITDCGLTRNEELKAAGNGVVPQQAELALRILLGFDIPKALERERERFNSDSNCLPYQYARRTNRKIPDQTGQILDRSDWKEPGCCSQNGARQVNLPTPTVSDTFTDNLASTQQKEGSMHSVTLPQAIRMLLQTDFTNDIE